MSPVYKKGRENYDLLKENGILVKDASEHFYVYQLIMDGHKQTGIVGCCTIDDYFNNVIKKHELTRPDKEEDRKNHVRYGEMNAEPVFFSYPHVNEIDAMIDEVKQGASPVYDITTVDGIQHTLWIVEGAEKNARFEQLFDAQVPSIYVCRWDTTGPLQEHWWGKSFERKWAGTQTTEADTTTSWRYFSLTIS